MEAVSPMEEARRSMCRGSASYVNSVRSPTQGPLEQSEFPVVLRVTAQFAGHITEESGLHTGAGSFEILVVARDGAVVSVHHA